MGFTSEVFTFCFFPVSIAVFFITHLASKGKSDNYILVLLSLIFFSWGGGSENQQYILIFIIFICAVHLIGNCIYLSKNKINSMAKNWVRVSIIVLTTVLFAIKYLNFLISQLNVLLNTEIKSITIIAPVGISFIVFEAISYLVDIYRGDAEPGSLSECALFLTFFPKLVSGPIVLWKDFRTQSNNRKLSLDKVVSGINRVIIGYAKKAIIADTFGLIINKIESQIRSGVDTPTMWLFAILYFFQIYYDFSGYSDIAIGSARIIGFEFKENFNYPYMSLSITEFWRRWHISLGTWFREYVYIPLGGNKRGNVYINLFIVFLLTGIWHGSNWTFVLWGIWNGIIVIAERMIKDKAWYNRIPAIIRWLFTMIFIGIGWILFRASDINTAFAYISAMFRSTSGTINFTWRYYFTQKTIILLIIAAIGSISSNIKKRIICSEFSKTITFHIIYMVSFIILFVIAVLFITNSSYSPFLYFQF